MSSTRTPHAGVDYNAQDHTVTVDGVWPVCAACDNYGSHEDCVAAENHRYQVARHAQDAA